MAIAPHDYQKGVQPSEPASKPDEGRARLRHDRILAGLVFAGMIALLALLIWLGSLSDSSPTLDYDYWMMF